MNNSNRLQKYHQAPRDFFPAFPPRPRALTGFPAVAGISAWSVDSATATSVCLFRLDARRGAGIATVTDSEVPGLLEGPGLAEFELMAGVVSEESPPMAGMAVEAESEMIRSGFTAAPRAEITGRLDSLAEVRECADDGVGLGGSENEGIVTLKSAEEIW